MKITVKPDLHQIEGTKYVLDRKAALLNFGTGSGKSIIVILSSFYLLDKTETNKILIVCTKSATLSFKNDFKDNSDYTPKFIDTKEGLFKHLASPDKEIIVIKYGIVKKCLIEKPNLTLGVIETSLDMELVKLIKKANVSMFFDEFHTLKNPKAQITHIFKQLIPYSLRVYGLTATTYTRNLYDVFNLINLLVPKYLGTKKSFTESFINVEQKEYYVSARKSRSHEIIVSYKNLSDLKEILKNVMMVYQPKLNTNILDIKIELQDIEGYEIASKGILSNKITDNEDDIKSFSARLIDLQYVVDRDKNKLLALQKITSEIVEKQGCVIFCDYKESLAQALSVIRTLPTNPKVMIIDGDTSEKKRDEIKNDFTLSPENKILAITPAGGQSLNLQATNNLILFNIPYDAGKYTQVIGRICRQYSKHDVFNIYRLCVMGTIDEYKLTRLESQLNTMDQSLGISLAEDIEVEKSFNATFLEKLRKKYLWKPDFVKGKLKEIRGKVKF